MDPQPFSFTLIQSSTANTCSVYFLQALFSLFYCKHLFPHDTFNPLFSANRWDWQPHWMLGQSILVVLCAGSTLLLTPVVRPAKSQPATPSEVTRFSYWSIKPWFLTEGKLVAVLIIPSYWGFPTVHLFINLAQPTTTKCMQLTSKAVHKLIPSNIFLQSVSVNLEKITLLLWYCKKENSQAEPWKHHKAKLRYLSW